MRPHVPFRFPKAVPCLRTMHLSMLLSLPQCSMPCGISCPAIQAQCQMACHMLAQPATTSLQTGKHLSEGDGLTLLPTPAELSSINRAVDGGHRSGGSTSSDAAPLFDPRRYYGCFVGRNAIIDGTRVRGQSCQRLVLCMAGHVVSYHALNIGAAFCR